VIVARRGAKLIDMGGVVVRVATWSARHPWRAIAGWVLFIALCVAAGAAAGTNKGTIADARAHHPQCA
jgi:putative drug exporter of the RND superfamily